jgi:DNA-binding MarR family transcriptional regulator
MASQKRGVLSAERRLAHCLLITDLQQLQSLEKYSSLYSEIQEHIDHHVFMAQRSRESDRRAVVDTLREWRAAGIKGVGVDEIADDTGLSQTMVRKILAEMIDADQAAFFEKETDRQRGRQTKYYFLR